MAKPDPTDKLLDELLSGRTPEEVFGEGGLLSELKKRLVERALEGEMTHHLGYPPASPAGKLTGNSRNLAKHVILRSATLHPGRIGRWELTGRMVWHEGIRGPERGVSAERAWGRAPGAGQPLRIIADPL